MHGTKTSSTTTSLLPGALQDGDEPGVLENGEVGAGDQRAHRAGGGVGRGEEPRGVVAAAGELPVTGDTIAAGDRLGLGMEAETGGRGEEHYGPSA